MLSTQTHLPELNIQPQFENTHLNENNDVGPILQISPEDTEVVFKESNRLQLFLVVNSKKCNL